MTLWSEADTTAERFEYDSSDMICFYIYNSDRVLLFVFRSEFGESSECCSFFSWSYSNCLQLPKCNFKIKNTFRCAQSETRMWNGSVFVKWRIYAILYKVKWVLGRFLSHLLSSNYSNALLFIRFASRSWTRTALRYNLCGGASAISYVWSIWLLNLTCASSNFAIKNDRTN